jgi:hypothetical protein
MQVDYARVPSKPASKAAFWGGWVLAIVPAGMMVMSAAMKLVKPPQVSEGMAKFGWPERYLPALAAVELACVILFLIPRTAVLGAILMTGYLGGACATHARLGDPMLANAVVLGVFAWLGLYLRDPRVRELAPLRRLP